MPAYAYVGGWPFAARQEGVLGGNSTVTVMPGDCVVATGTDAGRVLVRNHGSWLDISTEDQTDPAYILELIANSTPLAFIRRDGRLSTPLSG
jgi:hypothetical protein